MDINILKLVNEELGKRNIQEEVKNIFISDFPRYDNQTSELYITDDIYQNWLVKEIKDLYKINEIKHIFAEYRKISKNLKKDFKKVDESFLNNLLIFCAFHEVRHVEQIKTINKDYMNKDIGYLKNLVTSLEGFNPLLSSLYHDKFYHEYDANIDALVNITNLDIDIKEFNRYMSYKILVAYTNKFGDAIASPIDNTKEIFKNIAYNEDLDIYKYLKHKDNIIPDNEIEKLLLGYPLKEETIIKLKSIYIGEIKTNDIIKTLRR